MCIDKEFCSSNLKALTILSKCFRKLNWVNQEHNFKVKLAKLLDKYPKLKFSCLSLNFFKDYARGIKEVCKRGGDQFKLNYDSIILSG